MRADVFTSLTLSARFCLPKSLIAIRTQSSDETKVVTFS